mmetsp:Transcript_8846/g.24507  ORF Transcript_8846/g.24507 Transcript_8846/m.24507 type:complete len:101 (-) Transcript_8846:886-1188(-)
MKKDNGLVRFAEKDELVPLNQQGSAFLSSSHLESASSDAPFPQLSTTRTQRSIQTACSPQCHYGNAAGHYLYRVAGRIGVARLPARLYAHSSQKHARQGH